MPFRICKTFTVENGHLLSKHSGKCRFPHGHSRRIEIVLESPGLDCNDMVCDFKRLKELVQGFVDRLDHAMCINTADTHYAFYSQAYPRIVPFKDADPTSELMAKTLFDETLAALARDPICAGGHPIRVVRVRIHETDTSWAEYER